MYTQCEASLYLPFAVLLLLVLVPHGVWVMASGPAVGWVVHTFYSQQQSHKPHNQALVSVFMSIWILHAANKLECVLYVGVVACVLKCIGRKRRCGNGGGSVWGYRKLTRTALHCNFVCDLLVLECVGSGRGTCRAETDIPCALCLVRHRRQARLLFVISSTFFWLLAAPPSDVLAHLLRRKF